MMVKGLVYFGICIIVVLVLSAMLAGCVVAQPTPDPNTPSGDIVESKTIALIAQVGSDSVYRVIDDYAGVVCFIYTGHSQSEDNGIDCMPLADTKLYNKPR